jgi:hypothetical protein
MKSFLFLVVVCLLVWIKSESLPFNSEVKVYHGFCTGKYENSICDSKEEGANPITYKALIEQQRVIYWNDTGGLLNSHSNCTVRNSRNWKCDADADENGVPKYQWQMIDGDYTEIVRGSLGITSVFYQIPKWKWWWLRIAGNFSK